MERAIKYEKEGSYDMAEMLFRSLCFYNMDERAYFLYGMLLEKRGEIKGALEKYRISYYLGWTEAKEKLMWNQKIHSHFSRKDRECIKALLLISTRTMNLINKLHRPILYLVFSHCYRFKAPEISLQDQRETMKFTFFDQT